MDIKKRLFAFVVALSLILCQVSIPHTVYAADDGFFDWLIDGIWANTVTSLGNRLYDALFTVENSGGGGSSAGGGASREFTYNALNQLSYDKLGAKSAVADKYNTLTQQQRNDLINLYNTYSDRPTVLQPGGDIDFNVFKDFSSLLYNQHMSVNGSSPYVSSLSNIPDGYVVPMEIETLNYYDALNSLSTLWLYEETDNDFAKNQFRHTIKADSPRYGLVGAFSSGMKYLYTFEGTLKPRTSTNPHAYSETKHYYHFFSNNEFVFAVTKGSNNLLFAHAISLLDSLGNQNNTLWYFSYEAYGTYNPANSVSAYVANRSNDFENVYAYPGFYRLNMAYDNAIGAVSYVGDGIAKKYVIDYSLDGSGSYVAPMQKIVNDFFDDLKNNPSEDDINNYYPHEVYLPPLNDGNNSYDFDGSVNNNYTDVINNYIENKNYYYEGDTYNITYVTNNYYPDPDPDPTPTPTPPPGAGGGDDNGSVWDLLQWLLENVSGLIGDLLSLIGNVLDYLNPLSDNFFLKIALIPEEGFIDDDLELFRDSLETRIPLLAQLIDISGEISLLGSEDDDVTRGGASRKFDATYDSVMSGGASDSGMRVSTDNGIPVLSITLPEEYGSVTVQVVDFTFFDKYRIFLHSIIIMSTTVLFIKRLFKRVSKSI